MKKNLLVLLTLSLSVFVTPLWGQNTFTSIADGDWNNASVWDCGGCDESFPNEDDNAIITEYIIEIPVGSPQVVQDLTIDGVTSRRSAFIDVKSTLTVEGTLSLVEYGDIALYSNANLILSGPLQFLNDPNNVTTATISPFFDSSVTNTTVTYNGTSAQSIYPASLSFGSGIPYINLVINNPSGASLTATTRAKGTVTITSGTVSNPSYTFTLENGLVNNGVYNSSGTTIFSGSGKTISGSGTATFSSLTFNGSTILSNTGVAEVVSSGVVTLGSNVTLSGSGPLVLRSTSITQTARIAAVPSTSNITATNITIERFLNDIDSAEPDDLDWRYLASPFTIPVSEWLDDINITGNFVGASSGTTNPSMYRYDESVTGVMGEGYVAHPTTSAFSEFITEGIGYAVFQRAVDNNKVIDATGTPNVGDYSSFGLTYNETSSQDIQELRDNSDISQATTDTDFRWANDGWNLIGNPYPSPIAWSSVTPSDYSNITGAIYIKDNGGIEGTAANFAVYNPGSGIGTTDFSGNVAIGQGFWVQADGPNPSLTLKESMKTSSAIFLRKAEPSNVLRVWLRKDEITADEAVLHFNDNSTINYDKIFDATKLLNPYINIASRSADNLNLVINGMPIENCITIPLTVYSSNENGTYTLSFEGWETFNYEFEAVLVDNFTDTSVPVDETTIYEFTLNDDEGSKGKERFSLIVNKSIPTDVDISNTSSVCIGEDGLITILNSSLGVSYKAFINGNIVSENIGNGESMDLVIPSSELTTNATIDLKASTECMSEVEIQNDIVIDVKPLPSVNISISSVSEICKGDEAVLSLSNPESGVMYKAVIDGAIIHEEKGLDSPIEFIIPANILVDDVMIYFTASTECVEDMEVGTPIDIKVNELPTPSIERIDEYTLKSNYTEGNQWYFNDEVIEGAIGTELQIMETGVYSLEVTNENSCSARIDETLTVTSINDELAEFGAKVYPVPFDDILTIDASKLHNGHIMITSITGKMRHTQHLKKDINNIDLSSLERGLYLLKIKDKNKEVVVRIIKK